MDLYEETELQTILCTQPLLFRGDILSAAASAVAGSTPLPITIQDIMVLSSVVVFSLIIDLWAHREHKEISIKDAALWSIFWVGLSGAYYAYIYQSHGPEHAGLFLSGYVLEKSLSVDNLMVFIAIFSYFKIRGGLQHRILYYGILGAIVFRLIFVFLGALLMQLGPWADMLFAAIIAWSAVKMLGKEDDDGEEDVNYSEHRLVKLAEYFFAVFPKLDGVRFFISRDRARELAEKDGLTLNRSDAVRYMTPAFVCLLVVEASDITFAFDSVPAVIAVTREPLLVYSAMIFAILGLRSLYFILAALTKYLVHLEKAVIVLLFFIAAKLLLHATHSLGLHSFDLTPNQGLLVIAAVLGLGVIASLIFPAKEEPEEKKAEE